MTTIFAGAFAFGVGFDIGVTAFWDRWNQGVRSASLYLHSFVLTLLVPITLETMEGHPS